MSDKHVLTRYERVIDLFRKYGVNSGEVGMPILDIAVVLKIARNSDYLRERNVPFAQSVERAVIGGVQNAAKWPQYIAFHYELCGREDELALEKHFEHLDHAAISAEIVSAMEVMRSKVLRRSQPTLFSAESHYRRPTPDELYWLKEYRKED